MATIGILLIMAGCAAYQFFKGSVVRAVATLFVALIASFIAMGFFEYIAGLLVGFEALSAVGPWIYMICFALLFLIAFALFQTAVIALLREPIALGDLQEKVGRPVCGVLLGWVISGVVLVIASLAPLSPEYPYARFDLRNPKVEKPQRALFNPDGLICGWFSVVSRGSFSGISSPKSFATLRASFLDQVYLNRQGVAQGVQIMTREQALDPNPKPSVWQAPDTLVGAEDGQPLSERPGSEAMLVRLGFKRKAIKDISPFTLSQIRVVCKPKGQASEGVSGQGVIVFPSGYMSGSTQVQTRPLGEKISLSNEDFGDQVVRTIDFLFYVPSDQVPVLAEFKFNNVISVTSFNPEQAPAVIPFAGRKPEPAQNQQNAG